MDWKKARLFLEMRQTDVASAVGISIERLSQAERGMITLNQVERISLESFLRARLEAELEQMASAKTVAMVIPVTK